MAAQNRFSFFDLASLARKIRALLPAKLYLTVNIELVSFHDKWLFAHITFMDVGLKLRYNKESGKSITIYE